MGSSIEGCLVSNWHYSPESPVVERVVQTGWKLTNLQTVPLIRYKGLTRGLLSSNLNGLIRRDSPARTCRRSGAPINSLDCLSSCWLRASGWRRSAFSIADKLPADTSYSLVKSIKAMHKIARHIIMDVILFVSIESE